MTLHSLMPAIESTGLHLHEARASKRHSAARCRGVQNSAGSIAARNSHTGDNKVVESHNHPHPHSYEQYSMPAPIPECLLCLRNNLHWLQKFFWPLRLLPPVAAARATVGLLFELLLLGYLLYTDRVIDVTVMAELCVTPARSTRRPHVGCMPGVWPCGTVRDRMFSEVIT
jgi:hypothetical protein